MIKWKTIKRGLPLIFLSMGTLCFFYFRLYQYLSFSTLQQHHNQLSEWTKTHYLLMVVCYLIIYIIIVALSVPGALVMTLTGGYLFGLWWGTLYVVISATIGATFIFLAVKTAFGDKLADKALSSIEKMRKGFEHNALNYLLVLRLIPLFPFWLVNIVSAVLGVRLKTFVFATFFGIIPGSFVYASLGNSLGSLFAKGQTPNLKIIFEPYILLPLLGLAILSIIPLLYKKFKGNKI